MTDIFAGATETEMRDEKARRAVKIFRSMQPGLTGYAKAITKKRDVSVQLAEGTPQTDGKKIFIKPPIALGDLTPHDRKLCDKRDPVTYKLLCEACAIREDVLITVYHEIAHIAYGTFAPPSKADQVAMVDFGISEYGSKYAAKIRQRIENTPTYFKNDYLNLTKLVSDFLPIIVNSLEDARVDNEMFKARPGTKVMFDAFIHTVFVEGVPQADNSMLKWSEYPLNSQAMIGVFVLAAGYEFKGWFSPEVEKALLDPKLREIVMRIQQARSSHASYQLSFPVLARLRELGFCKLDNDPESEPEDDETQDDSSSDEPPTSDEPESGEASADDSQDGDQEEQGEQSEGKESSEGSGNSEGESDEQLDEGDSESESGAGDSRSDSSGTDEQDDNDEAANQGDEVDAGSDLQGDPDDDASSDPGEASGSNGAPDAEAGDPTEEGDRSGDDAQGSGSERPDSRDDQEQGGHESGVEHDDSGPGDEQEVLRGEEAADRTESGDDSQSGRVEQTSQEEVDDESSSERSDHEEAGQADSNVHSDDGQGVRDGAEAKEDQSTDGSRERSDSEPVEQQDSEPDNTDFGADGDYSEFSDEVIDSGADEGEGGEETRHNNEYMGTPEEVATDVEVFSRHDVAIGERDESEADTAAVDKAIVQGLYFETPSSNVYGVDVYRHSDSQYNAWTVREKLDNDMRKRVGQDADLDISETVLGPALMQTRKTFSDNARGLNEHNLRSGKVNTRVLGKRAAFGDERLFQKKRMPGKRSYAVVIGIDISGSTVGMNIALAKRAAMAQAELCNRVGIEFAVYGHSTSQGRYEPNSVEGYTVNMEMYEVKSFGEPWAQAQRDALGQLSSWQGNLDGHSIEYYRKMIEQTDATDKVILYYSDGKMPALNHDEELEILQREIRYCKSRNITLMGVGIRTDSPRRHGLDTVQVDEDADLVKVVQHLEKVLLRQGR